jgi:general stress protein 26
VERDPRACLTFADEANNRYVSLSGEIRLSLDPEEKRRLWSLPMRSQLPEGAEDSAVILLAFHPIAGEYWEGPSSRLVVAFRMATAIATGKRADLGENRKVSL